MNTQYTAINYYSRPCHYTNTIHNPKYAEIEARQQIERCEKKWLFKSLLKALLLFLYSYIRLGSFRFGSKGLAYAVLNLQYDISIALAVWEQNNGLGGIASFQRNDEVRVALMHERN